MKKTRHCRHLPMLAIGLAATIAALGAHGARAQTSCGPFIESSKELLNGDFLLGISYFGAVAIDPATGHLGQDLDFMKSRGINNVRVFANWTLDGAPDASVLNSDGSLKNDPGGPMDRFRALISEAEQRGMTVDVTFSWRQFGNDTCDDNNCKLSGPPAQSSCWTNFKTGLTNVGAALKAAPAHNTNIFYDVANEYFFPPDAAGCTVPGPGDVLQLANALRAGDPDAVLVTASGGRSDTNEFLQLLQDGTATFLAPHLARDNTGVWAEQTGNRIETIRAGLGGLTPPIHLQENNRRNLPPQKSLLIQICDDGGCKESDFLRAIELASEYGAAGWVFHTDAGFRLDRERFVDDGLDPTEKGTLDCDDSGGAGGVIDCLAEQVAAARCIAPPLVLADFEGDPAGGSGAQADELRVHLTERGGMDWLNDDNHLGIADEGAGRVLTSQGGMTPRTLGSIQYNLPVDDDGTVTLEARAAVATNSTVSVGFASNDQTQFGLAGEFWFVQAGDGGFMVGGTGAGWYDGPPYSGEDRLFRIAVNPDTRTYSAWLDGSLLGSGTLGSTPSLDWVTVQIDDPENGVTVLDNLKVTRD